MTDHSVTRRRFLAAGAAAGFAIRADGKAPAAERVRLGFIACGGRAQQLLSIFKTFSDVDIVALCDVNGARMEKAAGLLDGKPAKYRDYNRLLDRKDIDAVVIATTEHWHGLPFIHACQAGKAIFIEKPLAHTVAEGRLMVNAARKFGVLALMGTQQRAGTHYHDAVKEIQSGALGKIHLVECWNYHNRGKGLARVPDREPPVDLDWDRWLGPAPKVPFNPARLVYSWWFDYGGGMMTNWAVHHIDIILWAMKAAQPTRVTCAGGRLVLDDPTDTPDTIEASWEFPHFLLHYRYRGGGNFHTVFPRPHHHGIAFHGTQATLVLDRRGYEIWADQAPVRSVKQVGESKQDGPWQRLFVDSVKAGRKPPLELEESHRATVCCLLGNIAYHTRRAIRWDGEREEIIGDPEAAKLLDRPRRAGYELPVL
jgi:predicted dehydrogenase